MHIYRKAQSQKVSLFHGSNHWTLNLIYKWLRVLGIIMIATREKGDFDTLYYSVPIGLYPGFQSNLSKQSFVEAICIEKSLRFSTKLVKKGSHNVICYWVQTNRCKKVFVRLVSIYLTRPKFAIIVIGTKLARRSKSLP